MIVLMGYSDTQQELKGFPILTSPYLGQKPPGNTAERFAADILDSLYSFMPGVIVFSPDGKAAYWQARIRPETPNVPGTAGIMESKYLHGRWTQPQLASFSQAAAKDGSPFFSPDGKRLLFLSQRSNGGADARQKIWAMDATEKGWSPPKPLPLNLDSLQILGQFSMDLRGHIYFSVWNTIPRYTELDIYCAKFANGKYGAPEKLGPEINRPDSYSYSESPFIAPDGSYLIFTIRTFEKCRLNISYRKENGSWAPARDLSDVLGETMNCSNPFVTSDGKYLFFIRLSELDGAYPEGYGWIAAKFIEEFRPEK